MSPVSCSPRTLRSELKARGLLPATEVIELGRALSTSLAHLHSHDLVRRDITPANIVYVDGMPKPADIGLATMPFMNSEELNGLLCKQQGRGGRYYCAGEANC
ncbi:MAG: hypothetical protein EXS31_04875 [Pedosphaera sp.]|nr:hypothetical protein [Pedosphaera sp.]